MCFGEAYSFCMQFTGVIMCLMTYLILSAHIYGYFLVVAPLLKKRLGVAFGLLWIAIGMTLIYNIVFNHFWAMFIRPGNPQDLLEDEALRKEVKNREHRKEAKVDLDDDQNKAKAKVQPRKGTAEYYQADDRYDGLQKDVKKLMKYRIRTMNNLR